MSRRFWLTTVVAGLIVVSASGAAAATHYLITNVDQIKPSVLKRLKAEPKVIRILGPATTIGAGDLGEPTAKCPRGIAVGGGWVGLHSSSYVLDNHPLGNEHWVLTVFNGSANSEVVHAAVVCMI